MNKKDIAGDYYLGEYNCAQSVILSFEKELKISKDNLEKISYAFGGGIGGLQKICGAITGGVMVLGILKKDNSKDLVRKLINEFENKNDFSNCIQLIDIDFNDENYSISEERLKIKKMKCYNYVRDVVEIVENLINE